MACEQPRRSHRETHSLPSGFPHVHPLIMPQERPRRKHATALIPIHIRPCTVLHPNLPQLVTCSGQRTLRGVQDPFDLLHVSSRPFSLGGRDCAHTRATRGPVSRASPPRSSHTHRGGRRSTKSALQGLRSLIDVLSEQTCVKSLKSPNSVQGHQHTHTRGPAWGRSSHTIGKPLGFCVSHTIDPSVRVSSTVGG